MKRRNYLGWRDFALHFADDNDDDDKGGGGGGGVSKSAQLAALKAKYEGNLERALDEIFEANGRLVRKNEKLTSERDQALAKVPEGSVVLTKEDAAKWEEYKKVGEPSDVVKKSDLEVANGKLAAIELRTAHDSAAKVLGWNGTVLHDLVQLKELHVEVKDETENGKAVKRVYVRPKADEKAPLVLLQKHVEEKLADHLPSLKAGGTSAGPVLPNQQSAEGGKGGGSVVDSWLKEKDEAAKGVTNPLQQPQAVTTT